MKLPRFAHRYLSSTQPDVIAMDVEARQRQKDAELAADLEQLLLRHKNGGHAPRRIAQVIGKVAKAFEKLAA
jgi:hypothetical protein